MYDTLLPSYFHIQEFPLSLLSQIATKQHMSLKQKRTMSADLK